MKHRGTTPTQRTLSALRDAGYTAEVVERWNPHTRTRHDLFGFIDILAVRGGETLGVQATSTGVSKRLHKIRTECRENALCWLAGGNRIEVWGWRKLKVKRGGKAVRWAPRVEQVTTEELQDG